MDHLSVYIHTKCSTELPWDNDSPETFLHALADKPQYIKSSHTMGTADPTAGSHCGPSNFMTITTCCRGSGYVVILLGSNDKLAAGHRTSSSTVCSSCTTSFTCYNKLQIRFSFCLFEIVKNYFIVVRLKVGFFNKNLYPITIEKKVGRYRLKFNTDREKNTKL